MGKFSTTQNHPLVLYFFGPSGTGKTYLTRLVASILHNVSLDQIEKKGVYRKFDMGNYQLETDVNNLLGAPKGYEGGEGNLVKVLEKQPRAVIVFDEISKAHYSFSNILMAMLDINGQLEGKWTGQTISTTQTTFILTSNIGSEEIESYWRDHIQYTSQPIFSFSTSYFWEALWGNTRNKKNIRRNPEFDYFSSSFQSQFVEIEERIFSKKVVEVNGMDRINFFSDSALRGRITTFVPFFPASLNASERAIQIELFNFKREWKTRYNVSLLWRPEFVTHFGLLYMKKHRLGFRPIISQLSDELMYELSLYHNLWGKTFLLYISSGMSNLFEIFDEMRPGSCQQLDPVCLEDLYQSPPISHSEDLSHSYWLISNIRRLFSSILPNVNSFFSNFQFPWKFREVKSVRALFLRPFRKENYCYKRLVIGFIISLLIYRISFYLALLVFFSVLFIEQVMVIVKIVLLFQKLFSTIIGFLPFEFLIFLPLIFFLVARKLYHKTCELFVSSSRIHGSPKEPKKTS